jgi:hypothetical protein
VKKKKPLTTWSRELFEKIPKESPHFKEENMKLPRFLEDLGRFLAYLHKIGFYFF